MPHLHSAVSKLWICHELKITEVKNRLCPFPGTVYQQECTCSHTFFTEQHGKDLFSTVATRLQPDVTSVSWSWRSACGTGEVSERALTYCLSYAGKILQFCHTSKVLKYWVDNNQCQSAYVDNDIGPRKEMSETHTHTHTHTHTSWNKQTKTKTKKQSRREENATNSRKRTQSDHKWLRASSTAPPSRPTFVSNIRGGN